MVRARRRLIWPALAVAQLAVAAPIFWAAALGQNLDAGKSPSQIFSEVCANCHRSTREVRNASASFLREHYTTGSEMASSLANYLASAAADRAPTPPQPKRPPAPTTAAASAVPTPPAPVPAGPGGRDGPATTRGRPATVDTKPVAAAPQAPARPVLEEFEE